MMPPRKPNDADKIYITGKAGQYSVVPPTAYARSRTTQDAFEFKNLTDQDALVVAADVFASHVKVTKGGTGTAMVNSGLQDGAYDYLVVVGPTSLAQGNSAPRIIIDG